MMVNNHKENVRHANLFKAAVKQQVKAQATAIQISQAVANAYKTLESNVGIRSGITIAKI